MNQSYEKELSDLNSIQAEMNGLSTELASLRLRRELIMESRHDLEQDLADIDLTQIRRIYGDAEALIGKIHRTFEETVAFHNQMLEEKVRFITGELPRLEATISEAEKKLARLNSDERQLGQKLAKVISAGEYELVSRELSLAHEQRGRLEEKRRLWRTSFGRVEAIDADLAKINEGIGSKDEAIQQRIAKFNTYFAEISERLYGETFILSSERTERGYDLNITTLAGNLGTGKKKVEMAAFDLAYIRFADEVGIPCLHFVLQDQIENVHDNQITQLLTEIVDTVNCQYVLPVLRDKLPVEIDTEAYMVLSLSQEDKLFGV